MGSQLLRREARATPGHVSQKGMSSFPKLLGGSAVPSLPGQRLDLVLTELKFKSFQMSVKNVSSSV